MPPAAHPSAPLRSPLRPVAVLFTVLCLLVAGLARAAAPKVDGDWPMPAHDFANTRYSPLDEIKPSNVAKLRLAWSFTTGIEKGHEAAPIVVGSRMYVVTPYPNKVFAFDLAKAGRDDMVAWEYAPKVLPAAQGVACCDVVNRGACWADGRLFINTLDGQTIALDAASGKELWTAQVGEIHKGETVTMAPLVVKGKVLVGNSGGEMGVRGWLKALDAATGRLAWTAWSTGPDTAVRIGPSFRPFYAQDRGRDLGVTTWPPGRWQIGGGTAWGFVSYDPKLDLIYYGTSNPGIWNAEMRPGDNKWSCGVFARTPATGEARWFYQFSPHDLYDHDGVNENVVVDLALAGGARRVLLHADRNGLFYVLDAATGEVLSATAFGRVNSNRGVDLATGRLIPVDAKKPTTGKVVRDIAPAAAGAKDWQPMAWSPRTGLVYIPHHALAMDFEGTEASYIEGTPYVGANVRMYPDPVSPGGGNRGLFTAWDPVRKRAAWRVVERFPVWSGALVTAGDVVFYGTMDGWFKALDARTGKVLWKAQTASGIIGQPVAYRGPDGKEYVAVLAGVGGWAGAIVVGGLDPRDVTAATGFVNAMKDLPSATRKGGALYVYALP